MRCNHRPQLIVCTLPDVSVLSPLLVTLQSAPRLSRAFWCAHFDGFYRIEVTVAVVLRR